MPGHPKASLPAEERILGVDPGLAATGFGVIAKQNGKWTVVEYGCISTAAKLPLEQRLHIIHQELSAVITKFQPATMAVEELFFAQNVSTAMVVSQARGVVLLTAAQHGLPVSSYTPLQIKQALVSYGRASKNQVQQMVKAVLGMDHIPQPDHAADALAAAICAAHSQTYGSKTHFSKNRPAS